MLQCSKPVAKELLYGELVKELTREGSRFSWRFRRRPSGENGTRDPRPLTILPRSEDRAPLYFEKPGTQVRVSIAKGAGEHLDQVEYLSLIRYSFEPIHDFLREKLAAQFGELTLVCPTQ